MLFRSLVLRVEATVPRVFGAPGPSTVTAGSEVTLFCDTLVCACALEIAPSAGTSMIEPRNTALIAAVVRSKQRLLRDETVPT